MIKGYFDIPGEFRKTAMLDVLPEPGATVVLDDNEGTGHYRVRHIAHQFFRGGGAEFRDQMVVVYLSEEGAAA